MKKSQNVAGKKKWANIFRRIVGKLITEEEFDKLAEKRCLLIQGKIRYKVWTMC